MSRSNPTANSQSPCTRWFEWGGASGTVKYYDKDKKETVDIGSDFTFILLDELSTVKGWHDSSQSGIYANEVRNTRENELTVKAFKGGVLAQGLYKDIKDKVNAFGGKFTTNCYIAYKDGGTLKIGSLQLAGAALNEWVEFKKEHKGDIYTSSVRINGSKDGKKGSVKFKTPKFSVGTITEETDEAACLLDRELQEYLNGYMARKPDAETVPEEPVTAAAAEDNDETIPF